MSTAAVIVTYYPEQAPFIDLLKRMEPQVEHVVIVDNTPWDNDDAYRCLRASELDLSRISLTRLGMNCGIAAALNVGIRAALDDGYDFVLLSDQDSKPSPEMVQHLLRAYAGLAAAGVKVAAIGPTFIDQNTGNTFPFQVDEDGSLFYKFQAPSESAPLLEVLTLITSGSLIPGQVLSRVGLMREDFFIDFVDTEWCHRARSLDYRLYGTGLALMQHRMGNQALRVWMLGWRMENGYERQRIYYHVRNYCALTKLSYVRWRWKFRTGWWMLGFVYSHVLFGPSKDRRGSALMAWRGFLDGVFGRMGPRP
jgi:rhamnosyltransferase